ncbi:hypothetical protein ACULNC_22405 [Shigella flexneri]
MVRRWWSSWLKARRELASCWRNSSGGGKRDRRFPRSERAYSGAEYIKEAQGCDIRCLVVGDEVVAAIERRAKRAISFQFASWRRGKRRQYHTTGA